MRENSPALRVCLLLITLLFSVELLAQTPSVVTQPIEWFSLTSNIKIQKRVSLIMEGQLRFASDFEPMQYQFRTGVDFELAKNLFVVPLAYVYSWNYQYGKQPATYSNNEHRIWQQVLYKQKAGKVMMSHRLRLEQRFLEIHVKEDDGEVVNEGYNQYLNRLRYRFAAHVPLNNSKLDPKTLYASFYDEVFYSWGAPLTFQQPDQNRFFAGLGYQSTKAFSFQGGFLYQMLIKSNGTMQENNLGFQLQLNYNIDLTHKEN